MFKAGNFSLVAAVATLLLTGCNKDNEITIDSPVAEAEFTVIEYLPAPGQFINEPAAGYNNVTTMAEACSYAQNRMDSGNFVSLGAWGGYIVVKASEPIYNNGEYNFAIAGNAFDTSNEPGIVWVMQDTNGNGLPDDQWYELKGSWFDKEGYQRDYWVTYYRPSADNSDVAWKDSDGHEGVVEWNSFHKQSSYFPAWVKEDSYTLYGSRLPARAYQNPETGIWSNDPFEWGYADNDGDDSVISQLDGVTVQKNLFRLADAVDSKGNPVMLESIDFIKVQTAINGRTSVTGENSTEVCGFSRSNIAQPIDLNSK